MPAPAASARARWPRRAGAWSSSGPADLFPGGHAMIEKRAFGRTVRRGTVTLFGAAALAQASQGDADRALEVLLRHGVNHIDTAARYGDSELRIGPWMARHRKDFFLATKTGSRTATEARADIHRSLERLRVDHVDMIQLHSLGHPDDWDQAMGPGGAWRRRWRRARRGSSASSASPGTAGRSPPCIDAAWRASTSIPCSCPSTSSSRRTSATGGASKRC